ncbi:hypothetical protein DNTS_023916 [Danionella cerebrum]|uniref:Uncharacterized protein n=1 Tax=Danionella cerebrum TaxID=2873325 RepID=A0A553MV00_9TELE|nr:hypothetical protein DNTS_023916 [Danionella translucida]
MNGSAQSRDMIRLMDERDYNSHKDASWSLCPIKHLDRFEEFTSRLLLSGGFETLMSRCGLQHLPVFSFHPVLNMLIWSAGSAPVVCHMLSKCVWAVLAYVGGLRAVVKRVLGPFVLELGRDVKSRPFTPLGSPQAGRLCLNITSSH